MRKYLPPFILMTTIATTIYLERKIMPNCIKCGCRIEYTSASERGYWSCSRCGQETNEAVD